MEFPLDAVLDLPGGEVTVSLARRGLRLGTTMSFAELQEELLVQHDVRLTDSTLDALMQSAGGVGQADRQKELEELAQSPRGLYREQKVASQHPAPKRLYISCDGITYRTRYREEDPEHAGQKRVIYQEMKAGCVFWEDAKGRWHKQVVAGREGPDRFGLSLWKLAVECGMLQCPQVVFIVTVYRDFGSRGLFWFWEVWYRWVCHGWQRIRFSIAAAGLAGEVPRTGQAV